MVKVVPELCDDELVFRYIFLLKTDLKKEGILFFLVVEVKDSCY